MPVRNASLGAETAPGDDGVHRTRDVVLSVVQ
jgi:hypothetical protein